MVLEIKEKSFLSPPSVPSSQSTGFNTLNNRISPSILLIIIILAVIFFISGLLHLLVRFLLRPSTRNSDEIENLTALQGQLQQLFNLHDSGVDQSFIDSLPIFNYKAIIGLKDPFDCAVCLSEFEVDDDLRLLPKCSHAFHVDCIDTWLLSHSTCPICRANLVQDFNHGGNFLSPVVRVLESGSESLRGDNIVVERESSSHVDDGGENKASEVGERESGDYLGERVVAVKLGKFRNVGGGDGGEGGGAEARRCFSMGSCAYVLDENLILKVAITTNVKKGNFKKRGLGKHRTAMSECGCDSRREFNGFDSFKVFENNQSGGNENSKSIFLSRRDSFSMSKIWLSGRKDKESSRRAYSFRLPTHRNPVGAGESEIGGGGGDGGGEFDFDEEIGMQRCKVIHSTYSTIV